MKQEGKIDGNFAIRLDGQRLGYGRVVLSCPGSVEVPKGICAVAGPNGSGKTTLGRIIAQGRYAYGNRLTFPSHDTRVKMLAFTDVHSFTGIDVERHSQRFEATANDYVPSVAEIIGPLSLTPEMANLCRTFALDGTMGKKINFLSTGELRKLLIANALLRHPDILILDNPYLGLDAVSRAELDKALLALRQEGIDVFLLLCDFADIPEFADSVIRLEQKKLLPPISDQSEILRLRSLAPPTADISSIQIPPRRCQPAAPFEVAFSIEGGRLSYGEKVLLEGFDWIVRKGERWVLTGPNGSGKSLLLSMICGDHPQAYSNRINLFDRPRGSGESIWDIKDRIGYICPEMQLYFRGPSTLLEYVGLGLRKSLAPASSITKAEEAEAMQWLALLGISHLAYCSFPELSMGEQRLAMLARILIKQPELMILDEPLHGLDARSKQRVRSIIDLLAKRNGTTLIFVSHFPREVPSSVKLVKRIGPE